MSCNGNSSQSSGDALEVVKGSHLFGESATGWVLGEAVRHLNSADKEGEASYQRTVEQLRKCGDDLVETVNGLSRQAGLGGSDLRWSLLYVMGDAGKANAAQFLVASALEKLPERNPDEGCESVRDSEMLVRTMAIQAIGSVAKRYPEVAEAVLEVVKAQPARPLLIEAVKVAVELGLRDQVRTVLSEKEHWILDIRRAHVQEVFANPEREDGKERSFTPPKFGMHYTAPKVACCTTKEK